MSRSTEDLIAALAAEAKPVKRLRPPSLRAAAWLAILLALAASAVVLFADLPDFARRTGPWRQGLAWAASLATGVAAVVAAAHLSLPDRSQAWALVPLPFLAAWIALSGLGCLGLPAEPDGDSAQCFVFVVASGLVLGGFLFWRLRRAHPLEGRLVAAVGALGAAGLSAALLQFFHPFAITWLDLAVHLGAVAVLIGIGTVASRLVAGPRVS